MKQILKRLRYTSFTLYTIVYNACVLVGLVKNRMGSEMKRRYREGEVYHYAEEV